MDKLSRAIYKDTGFRLDSYSDMLSQRQGVSLERIEQKIKTGWPTEFAALEKAREASRASSEFTSVRARAYPGIWQKKTQEAINQTFKLYGEDVEGERAYAKSAVERIAGILKNDLPGHQFKYTTVVEGKGGDYQLVAEFLAPSGERDARVITRGLDQETARALDLRLSEGMDLTESGRPLNLRRVPDETEEQKELDERDRERRREREQRVAQKRRADRDYQAFVKKVKEKMEDERRSGNR